MSLAWVKPHLFWIALIAVGLVGGRAYLQEHDARLLSDAKVDAAQSQIKAIQTQASSQIAKVRTIVVQAKTPIQQVAAIPMLTDVPLNARIAPTLEAQPPAVTVDLQPLVSELQTCKTCTIQLTECQQINYAKDAEIVALKKRPAFWGRVGSTLKVVAIGIGIGAVLGAHI